MLVALMESIAIKHPDSEDFIDAKMTQGKVTGANVSVKIDDEFMEAATQGTTYTTQYPVESKVPKYTKEINANKLWKKIVHNAWKSAEPGILFWDTIIKESIPDCYADLGFKTVSTNPSLRGDTLVLTNKGVFPIKELASNNEKIWVKNIRGEWQPAEPFLSGIDKTLYEIQFTNGQKIYATKEHKHPILNTSGNIINPQTGKVKKKTTTELSRGDKLYLPSFSENPIEVDGCELTELDGFTSGWLTGDGWVSYHKTNKTNAYGFIFSEKDRESGISDIVINNINNIIGEGRKVTLRENKGCYETYSSNNAICEYFNDLGQNKKSKGLPTKIWKSNHRFISGFIDGIFSSDGYIDDKRNKIILTSSHEKLLKDIQKLLNFYGIRSNVKTHYTKSNFGTDKVYVRHDLYISTIHCEKFAKVFSLTHKDKNKKLKSFIGKNFGKIKNNRDYLVVKSVTKTNLIEDVYDITVWDDTHTFQMEGGITGNCGEITLCPDDSCRLLAMNLYGYVVNPFTKDAYFDWEEFKKDAIIAERLMDDIVDLELEKVDKIIEKIQTDVEQDHIKKAELQLWLNIKDKATRGRRTGLGITAEGDMLAALGFKYGTDEANDFSEEIHKTLKLEAYRSSVIMAKERGAFPMWDGEREKDNPFILRIKEEDAELYEMMMKYGRRNLALLTIAPTGSVSIMTQTSSGIECVFLVFYTRRRKINPNDKDVRVDFTDEVGDTWMEYPVFHHKFEDWLSANGYDVDEVKNKYTPDQINELIKLSPYYGATSNDVDWVKKVEMQGKIQKHVDHSISVTVNLPNDITEEMVGKVYEMGWRSGCFKEGNSIYTNHGIKDISQITVGDEVYGHDGKLHIVDEIYDLPEETRKFVRFKLNGYQSIESTSEHPFLVIELDESENKKSWHERTKNLVWKKADEIKLNDHLVVPNNFENNNKRIDRLDLTNFLNCNFLIEKDEIFLSRILPWKENKMVKSANSKPIPRYLDIDEDLSYFIGWFIAEGHFSSESYVRFTLNLETEVGVANKLIAIGKEKFNLDGYKEIKHSNGGVSLTVQFGSRLLSNIMRSFCGQYSDNKHLPEWFMKIKPELLKIMIDCHYDGDKGITISDRLNRELLMARNILNERIYASDNYGQGYEVKLNDSSAQSSGKLFENYYAYRVFEKQISYSNEKVYNFSVEDVDSYIVNGVTVHNCKGITVYRDGSRSGVLISDNDKKEKEKKKLFDDNHAPKRPKRLQGEIVRFQNNHEKWIAVVGMLDGRPYEIFTGLLENGLSNLPSNITECEVIKVKDEEGNKRYDIEYFDSNGEKQIHTGLNHSFNSEYWNYAKMISSVLRHGMPIPYVLELVKSLNLNDDHLNTWKNGVGRVIKRFIKDGEKGEGQCPECGSGNLEYKEGCLTCASCGSSRCS